MNDFERSKIEEKVDKYQTKADAYKLEANKLARSVGYSPKAEKYATKADKYAYKAAEFRRQIRNDDRYRAALNTKISKLSEEELNGRYSFVKDLIRD